MGAGDAWPDIRRQVLAADVLVLATPTWMGHMSSVAQRVLERLDAELSETDGDGRPGLFDKVAIVAVVGNEDGAHKVSADLFQALNDVGYTIPAQGVTYWNGEAMHSTDYRDLDETPEVTASTTAVAARNPPTSPLRCAGAPTRRPDRNALGDTEASSAWLAGGGPTLPAQHDLRSAHPYPARRTQKRPTMTIGASLLLIAVGAVLKFAVTATVSGIDISTVGVVLMVVGAVGLVLGLVMMASRRRTDVITHPGRTTYVEPNNPNDPRI